MRPEAIVRSFFFGGFLITQGRGQPGYNIPCAQLLREAMAVMYSRQVK
jgi:hypothetical protein